MLRFAVCDDEALQLQQTMSLLDDYIRSRPELNVHIEAFTSGDALLARAEQLRGFDLYVMDILMPELNGIETGRRLRALGDGGEIIYITNSNDFAADSYNVRAFFYLLKPVNERKITRVIDSAVKALNRRRNSALVVNTAGGSRRILLDHILYVERTGRRMRFHCTDGIVDSQTIRASFRETTAPLLNDRRFWLCGASYVLNFQHVTGQHATLNNGQSVALPRATAVEFKLAWVIIGSIVATSSKQLSETGNNVSKVEAATGAATEFSFLNALDVHQFGERVQMPYLSTLVNTLTAISALIVC